MCNSTCEDEKQKTEEKSFTCVCVSQFIHVHAEIVKKTRGANAQSMGIRFLSLPNQKREENVVTATTAKPLSFETFLEGRKMKPG